MLNISRKTTDCFTRVSRQQGNHDLAAIIRTKKIPGHKDRVLLVKSLAVTYFHMGSPTLSSALSSFTSEFEMGSGGSHLLMPPGKLFAVTEIHLFPHIREVVKASMLPASTSKHQLLGCYMVKPHGQLVLVSFTHYCASTPSLSTLWSSRALQDPYRISENSSWEGLPA